MTDAAPYLFQRGWFWLGVVALAGCIAVYHAFFRGDQPEDSGEFNPRRHILMPLAPVTDFAIKPAGAVHDELEADELVLAVTIGSEARAYPVNMMNAEPQTKALNDTLAGQALAITWCDRCMTGIVYERMLGDRTLTFGIMGQLWKESMVLYDRETMTQWSQWEGKGKAGPLKDQTLRRVPSFVTDWQSWRTKHPVGSVALLKPAPREFTKDTYGAAGKYLLAYDDGTEAKAWPLEELQARGLVQDWLGDKAVVAVFQPSSGTARLFERQVKEDVLSFHGDQGQLIDDATGSTWDPLTGRATAGAMKGEQLRSLPGVVTARSTWKLFHPKK